VNPSPSGTYIDWRVARRGRRLRSKLSSPELATHSRQKTELAPKCIWRGRRGRCSEGEIFKGGGCASPDWPREPSEAGRAYSDHSRQSHGLTTSNISLRGRVKALCDWWDQARDGAAASAWPHWGSGPYAPFASDFIFLKSAKWLTGIRFGRGTTKNRYWRRRGLQQSRDPWEKKENAYCLWGRCGPGQWCPKTGPPPERLKFGLGCRALHRATSATVALGSRFVYANSQPRVNH